MVVKTTESQRLGFEARKSIQLDGVGSRMSETGTSATRARAAAGLEPVALVGDGAACDAIAETLQREGFQATRFPSVQALERDGEGDRSPVVLWLDDAVASVRDDVEPLTRSLKGRPAVVVCPSIERWELRAILALGVVGVVTGDRIQERLGCCLRAVCVDQVCVPREHWRQVEPAALSAREKQVLGLVVTGCMNSEIAARLFLAESTVKSHLSSVFGKLGVRSRNEAVDLITRRQPTLGLGIPGLERSPAQPADAERVVLR